jgi:predicted dehydrogenase
MQARRKTLGRRQFIRGLAAAVAAPIVVRPSSLGLAGTVAPSERIHMGLVGCGIHGSGWNLDQMFHNPDQQVVAVCDVDAQHAQFAEQRVNEHYSANLGYDYRCSVHHDFRELVNRPDVDAVAVATPDHWHVLVALTALRAGKHVICEKPLTLTVSEGRLLADEAKKSGLVFQTASENRSIDSHIRMCELVHAGFIGELRNIKVLLEKGNAGRGNADFRVQDPPSYLDYEMWQGPAPLAPYCPARVHNTFRWNLAYSGGRLTDWGAHLIDLAQWASGHQLTGPVEVEGTGKFPPHDAIWNTAGEFDLHYRYADGVTMQVWSEVPALKFEGSDGWIMFRGWRTPLRASRPSILTAEVPEDRRLHRPRVVIAREDELAGGEHLDFTDCIRHGGETYAPAEVGHRTATVAHIGNIAMQLQRKLHWNPDRERFVDDHEADEMLHRDQREPWTLAHVDSWVHARS